MNPSRMNPAQYPVLARRKGADAAVAAAHAGSAHSITVRLGRLEDVDRSESEEIGLRVFVGTRSASISTSDFARESLDFLAGRAVEMARAAPQMNLLIIGFPLKIAIGLFFLGMLFMLMAEHIHGFIIDVVPLIGNLLRAASPMGS